MAERQLTHAELMRVIALVKGSDHFPEFYLKTGATEIDLRTHRAAEPTRELVIVKSSRVGRFYRSHPHKPKPFVEIGDRVTADTRIGAILVLGEMQNVVAGCAGVVRRFFMTNGSPVQYGQALAAIDPDA